MNQDTRAYDIIIYGASGFVGRQAARYLARKATAIPLKLAIAGRNRERLEAIRRDLGEAGRDIDVMVADCSDQNAIDMIVCQTKVLMAMAGPYTLYGDAIVDACVRLRTHYVDITGEISWVRSIIDRYHHKAAADGTRIIPFCGFDSVPSDIGAFLVARHFNRTYGSPCGEVTGYFRMFGGFNGGTIASNFVRYETGEIFEAGDPFFLNPEDVHSPEEATLNRDPSNLHYTSKLGAWVCPFLMGPINTRVVRRSATLFDQWGEAYGTKFRYQEFTRCGPPLGLLKAAVITAAMATLHVTMSYPLTRNYLKKLFPKPGDGPSQKAMNSGWFQAQIVGVSSNGKSVTVTIDHQGDPGNRATVRFVCESALCLASNFEDLPGGTSRGGVLTPATALGDVLANRLRDAGLAIHVQSDDA